MNYVSKTKIVKINTSLNPKLRLTAADEQVPAMRNDKKFDEQSRDGEIVVADESVTLAVDVIIDSVVDSVVLVVAPALMPLVDLRRK